MYPDMFVLVRDVRAAPGQLSRYERNAHVVNDAITEGYVTADAQGFLTVTPAGEKQFLAQAE
jgi:hypothetical protein